MIGLLLSVLALSATPPVRPNIVLIVADDLGVNDLRCYGRREHNTPHLDRLAREGTRFTGATCAQPICSPSRAALLTGRAPARLHLTTFIPGRADTRAQRLRHPTMRQQLPVEETTLAEVLSQAGYATAAVGKWHLGGKGFGPTDQGFGRAFSGKGNTTPSAEEGGKGEYGLTAAAEQFISENRERPFFLFLSHHTPHVPLAAQQDRIERNRRAWNPLYAAVIETMDDAVGRLMAKLDALALRDRTIVVFTSDNGGLHVPELKDDAPTHNTPFRAGKGFLYEGGLRVPLIVRWPGHVRAGAVSNLPTVNTDLMPTLLQLAGVAAPPDLDGISIADELRGRRQPRDRTLFWHYPHYTNQGSRPAGAVREGRWKLIEHYEDGAIELYDLETDPGERRNVAARQKARAAALLEKLRAWRRSVGAQENTPNPDADSADHARLYEAVDISRLRPARTAAETGKGLAEWRALMDAVVPKAVPR